MNKLTAVVVVLGSASLGYYLRTLLEQPVRSLASYVFVDKLSSSEPSFLSATGTWQGTELANRINTVRIICENPARTCEMHQADVYGITGSPYLNLSGTTFTIAHLDNKMLTAVAIPDLLCVRQTLVIDRQAKTVSFVRTKITRKSCAHPCRVSR